LLGAGKEAYQKVRVHPVMLASDVPFQLSLSRPLLAAKTMYSWSSSSNN